MPSPLIQVLDLKKSFEGQVVLDGMQLSIFPQDTLVIIGRSGCGKSVLLKHLIGLMKPESGKIMVEGEEVTSMNDRQLAQLRHKFGMLFQGAALFDSLTVEENVGFALRRFTKLSSTDISKVVNEKLALVGLTGVEHLKPSALSGGMRKRVGLARAIAMRPQIILYDEPTTGLDPIMADAINNLITDLQQKLKTTSIVVTHDMTSAYKVGNRIAMLYQGRIIAEGSPAQIQRSSNPVVQQFITGSSHGPIDIHE